jgi:nitroreductase
MLDAIKKRRSYRDFKPDLVEEEKLKEILKAAMYAPSANHMRMWEFIVVKDKEVLDKLAATKQWSYFVNKASLCIVLVSKKDEHNKYWIEDGCISASHIYLEAVNQGLGTCFVQVYGSKRDDGEDAEKYVRKILDVPDDLGILCLMPLGYPKNELPEHSEAEFEKEKIHFEKY